MESVEETGQKVWDLTRPYNAACAKCVAAFSPHRAECKSLATFHQKLEAAQTSAHEAVLTITSIEKRPKELRPLMAKYLRRAEANVPAVQRLQACTDQATALLRAHSQRS